jgi:hypothetical protein
MIKLNLPSYDYLIKKQNDIIYIYDQVRKKYILLTPEEWVRQHFINYLITHISVPVSMIAVETSLKYNRLAKRADILVYSNEGHPLLLVECKAPTVQLNTDTLLQLSLYNKNLKAPLLSITNGLTNYFWKMEKESGSYKICELPSGYAEMQKL